MKTGPRGSPDNFPAAIRRLSRFPAASRRSRPSGTATSPFTRRRVAHRPPVIVTALSGTGRSRQAASGVGATGPGTVSCLVSASDAGVIAVVTIPPAMVVEETGRARTTGAARSSVGDVRTGRADRHDVPRAVKPAAPRGGRPGTNREDEAALGRKGFPICPRLGRFGRSDKAATTLVSRNKPRQTFGKLPMALVKRRSAGG